MFTKFLRIDRYLSEHNQGNYKKELNKSILEEHRTKLRASIHEFGGIQEIHADSGEVTALAEQSFIERDMRSPVCPQQHRSWPGPGACQDIINMRPQTQILKVSTTFRGT